MPEPKILTIITLSPLFGAFIILFIHRQDDWSIKLMAALSTFCSFILSIYTFVSFNRDLGFEMLQFREEVPWIPSLGISYLMGVDGISISMILLTGILSFACILVSFSITHRHKEFFILTLLSLTGVFGVFTTQDLFFFILFLGLASIPLYFIIGIWGSEKEGKGKDNVKGYAATKLILYLQLGSGLVLLGILGVYFLTDIPQRTFSMHHLLLYGSMAKNIQILLFPLLFIAFGIGAGCWPFHTWLPGSHSAAPPAASMILSGLLLKIGGYGLIRIAVSLMPAGAHFWMNFMLVFGVINIVYGALCAMRQTSLKYMLAYSSVSQMGFVIIAIAALNTTGLNGALYQMFSHGIIAAILFAAAGCIQEKTSTQDMRELGGLAVKMPFLAIIFILGGLALMGIPGTSGFAVVVLVLLSILKAQKVIIGILAITGLILTAIYVLRAIQSIFLQELKPEYLQLEDASSVEQTPLILLALVIILLGIAPDVLTDVSITSAEYLVNLMKGM